MGYAQDLVNAGYYGYAGWGDSEAAADFNATGGSGKGGYSGGGGSSADSYLSSAISSITSLFNTKPSYESVNPFSFDEALAKQASEAEYAPYYQETLTDYMSNVEKQKSRSSADLKTTLEQLNAGKEYYTGVERRALDKSIRATNEGYAGKGLFFSGVRPRDIQELQTNFDKAYGPEGYQTQRYAYQTQQAQQTNQRTIEDVTTAANQYQRDIERDKKYAIAGGVLQRKQEARDEYEIGRTNYYSNYA